MTSTKPVIIGMNNPLSDDPKMALYPHPQGSAGHRLSCYYCMCSGETRQHWIDNTERMNLVVGEWSDADAVESAKKIWPTLSGRNVVLLGQSVVRAFWLPRPAPLTWNVRDNVRWALVPHPSGRNRWYNDDLHAWATGLFLEELVHRSLLG